MQAALGASSSSLPALRELLEKPPALGGGSEGLSPGTSQITPGMGCFCLCSICRARRCPGHPGCAWQAWTLGGAALADAELQLLGHDRWVRASTAAVLGLLWMLQPPASCSDAPGHGVPSCRHRPWQRAEAGACQGQPNLSSCCFQKGSL